MQKLHRTEAKIEIIISDLGQNQDKIRSSKLVFAL